VTIAEIDGSGNVLVRVHVQPGARRAGVVGRHGDALKVRVTAPPVDGRANAAAIELLAAELGVPASTIAVVAGATARRKRLRITTPTNPDSLVAKIESLAGAGPT
jgi:uncharacterized protein (TIGR00251 family)